MNYPKWYSWWTSPDRDMEEAFHRSGLILFQIQRDRDTVIATRCPHLPAIPVGARLFDRLEIPEEVRWELLRSSGDARPIFLRTKVGIGLIDRTYAAEAGLFLYVHIHSRPRHLTALLNEGVLGDPEGRFLVSSDIMDEGRHPTLCREREYRVLADVWEDVEERQRGLLTVYENGMLDRSHLEDVIVRLSRYAGCRVIFDDRIGAVGLPSTDEAERVVRMRCHRPKICEAALLYMFLEVQKYALHREARVRVSTITGQDGEYLSLSVGYTVEDASEFGHNVLTCPASRLIDNQNSAGHITPPHRHPAERPAGRTLRPARSRLR